MQSLTCLVVFFLLRGTRAEPSGEAYGWPKCSKVRPVYDPYTPDCHNCDDYCSQEPGCELFDTSATRFHCTWGWDVWHPVCRDNWNWCAWPWQAKCWCTRCQWGGCVQQRELLNDGVEKARELIDGKLENMNHGWELFFGNKEKDRRQNYARGALNRMKEFLAPGHQCYTANCKCDGTTLLQSSVTETRRRLSNDCTTGRYRATMYGWAMSEPRDAEGFLFSESNSIVYFAYDDSFLKMTQYSNGEHVSVKWKDGGSYTQGDPDSAKLAWENPTNNGNNNNGYLIQDSQCVVEKRPCLALHVADPGDMSNPDPLAFCCGPPHHDSPSYGSHVNDYENNIGSDTILWIGWNGAKLNDATTIYVASLLIHELSHSSFITSISSQDWWDHPPQAEPSARDWSYNRQDGFDDGDLENFAQCYAEAHDCDAIAHLHPHMTLKGMTVQDIVDHAGQWDIPINNAHNWHMWMAHDECVSGDTQVETVTGFRAVRHLEVGVSIKGFNSEYEEVWCTVEAVSSNGRGVLHGDYTETHWIVRDGLVSHNGNDAPKTIGDLYTVFTDCPAMKNADGSAFTPIADTFCGSVEFTWDEYLEVFNSISRIIAATGTFWFDTSTFKHCHGEDCRHASWQAALPEVCSAMIACSENEDQCDDFEAVTGVFMEQHVTRSPGRRNMQAMTDTIVDAVRNPATLTSYLSSLMF